MRADALRRSEVAIARANYRVTYPARFMLVAAMNPCRCGYASDPGYICKRGAPGRCTADYQGRLSGPLLDRVDLQIEVPAQNQRDMFDGPPGEPSETVRARAVAARNRQLARQGAPNSELAGRDIDTHCPLDNEAQTLLRGAIDRAFATGQPQTADITLPVPVTRDLQASVILRLSEGDLAAARVAINAELFEPTPGRVMREYVVVPNAVVQSSKLLGDWLKRGHAFASTMPAKPSKKA